MIHIYYLKKVKELRVIAQDDARLAVNPYNYVKICPVLVTQVGIGTGTGMCYLIRLEDGTFIVIDGNSIDDVVVNNECIGDTPDILYNTMREQLPDGVKDIVVSAWVVTHGHGDHYGMVKRFSQIYEDEVTVKMLIGNDASDQVYKDMEDNRGFSFTSLNGRFGGCYHKKAHTGEQFFFPGITFTVLYTHEDYYPKVLDEHNNMSVVFDGVVNGEVLQKSVRDGQTRFIWLGDVQTLAANKICAMYGSALKCDVMQVAHHSHRNGGSLELYQNCNPSVAFCPGITVDDDPYANATHNKYLTDTVEQYYRQDTGNHTISFESLLSS